MNKSILRFFRFRKKRRINSLTDFLMAVKNDEFEPEFSGEELNYYGPISLTDDKTNNYAKVALDLKLIHGLSIGAINEYMPGLYVNSPVLTPQGEEYLREQSIFNKYPFFEKILLVVLTGIVSALTTLAVQFFTA